VAERRRLFFALWPNERARLAIAAAAEAAAAGAGLRGRRIPLARLHLTLLFLGDLDAAGEARAHAVAGALRTPGFEMTLDQVGSFRRARVLWVGARQAPAGLTSLWQGLRDGLADLAGERNRETLAPHVTSYRDVDHPLRTASIAPIRWPVTGFTLVHSTLGAQPAYHVVSHWPLQTASAPSASSVKTVQEPGGPE
jgi:RNA 2',3'-cyclic 3'-phosphodiesterase